MVSLGGTAYLPAVWRGGSGAHERVHQCNKRVRCACVWKANFVPGVHSVHLVLAGAFEYACTHRRHDDAPA
eukprot:1676560-Rhodomonas_salina.1